MPERCSERAATGQHDGLAVPEEVKDTRVSVMATWHLTRWVGKPTRVPRRPQWCSGSRDRCDLRRRTKAAVLHGVHLTQRGAVQESAESACRECSQESAASAAAHSKKTQRAAV